MSEVVKSVQETWRRWFHRLEKASLAIQEISHHCPCGSRCDKCRIMLLFGEGIERTIDELAVNVQYVEPKLIACAGGKAS